MKKPGSFSPASCCAPGSGLPPTTFASTAYGGSASRVSNFPANASKPRNISSGGAWRVASREQRQQQILAPEFDRIRTGKNLPPELIQLAGSLERLPNETKTELSNLFIDAADQLAREKKHCAPYLTALGFILSRAPFYAGPETVVSPDLVDRAYETFRSL